MENRQLGFKARTKQHSLDELEQKIAKAKEIHNDFYSYPTVIETDRYNRINIKCPKHGLFRLNIDAHISRKGCPTCKKENRKRNIPKPSMVIEEFIRQAKQIYGDIYNYSQSEFIKYRNLVRIICPEHGRFEITPKSHLKGKGCPRCSNTNSKEVRSKIRDELIKKAVAVHGNKYDYSLMNTLKTSYRVTIICPKHGEFKQVMGNHLKGVNCPKCANETSKIGTEEFVKRARKKHGDRYDYRLVAYVTCSQPVKIICPVHGEFEQTPIKHIGSNGCTQCVRDQKRQKRGEIFIKKANELFNNSYDYSMVEYIDRYRKVTIVCPIHGPFRHTPEYHIHSNGCRKCHREIGKKC